MLNIGSDVQGGLLVVSFLIIIQITFNFFRSGIPRLRVIFLTILCYLIWFCSFLLTLTGDGLSEGILWEILSFLGMASTLFVLFIGIYEILANPGVIR
ncbi:hypothetical protein [Methanospirillum lacunae]|uniref:Histidine kinase N-terminal 7TM region domain-containing protein n=1 Tax=Methanospirillum lacunae TaxID=668570 RepID=A0A2V2MZ36_9EURY|nr:hypothetical protein [Methanospirillum lacunae]PWR71595.1 hypothetical protein DK846_12130 [Methanospirillum lacunae]